MAAERAHPSATIKPKRGTVKPELTLPLPGFDFLLTARRPKKPKPFQEKVGQTAVPIYKMADGRWCVTWRDAKGAQRQRVTRVSLAKARDKAHEICLDIARGQVSSGRLTPDQLLQAAAALDILEPLQLSLDGLAREAEAAIRSTGGAALAEMARFWTQHHTASASRATVAEIHAELLASKRDHGLSARYWRGLDKDLAKFATAFPKRPIGEIRSKEILEYLRGLRFTRKHQSATDQRETASDRPENAIKQPFLASEVPKRASHQFELVTHQAEWRRRNNVHSQIVTLFRFAKDQGHLAQDRDTEPEKIPRLPKPRNAPPPRIFTPAELIIVLEHVKAAWLPWIVLGAFAGLRTAEIERLEWRDVLWEDALIHIREEVAKRTSRKAGDARYVPMAANLIAWLRPWRDAVGKVCPQPRADRETGRLGKNAIGKVCPHPRADRETGRLGKFLPGGKWGQNPLRHSWVSYRSAETSNLPQVADEAGNSTEISRTAYRNPRMKREAVVWFAIMPADTPVNVTDISTGRE